MQILDNAPPLDQHRRYTINEASSLLRQSRSKTYIDIGTGTLRVIRDGRRVYVPGSEIARRSSLGDSPC